MGLTSGTPIRNGQLDESLLTAQLPMDQRKVDSAVPKRQEEYHRLSRFDRTHAKSLVHSCHSNPDFLHASGYLANHSLQQCMLTSLPLVLSDFVTLWFLLYGSTSIIEKVGGASTGLVTRSTALVASLLLLPIAQLAGLYPAMGTSAAVEFRQLVRSAVVALCVFAGLGISQQRDNWLYFVCSTLLTICLAIPLLPTSRFVTRAISRRCRWWGAPTLVYADSASVGGELFRRLSKSQDRGLRPVAAILDVKNYLEEASDLEDQGIPTFPAAELIECATKTRATWVLIANQRTHNPNQKWLGEDAIHGDTSLGDPMAGIFHVIPNRVILSSTAGLDCGMWDRTHTVGTSCGLLVANSRNCYSSLLLKRFLDFSLSGLICLLASPILLAIAVAIRLSSPGPIFYGQPRIGRGGRQFMAWKFRTMVPDAEKTLQQCLNANPELMKEWQVTHKLKKDPRVTGIGRILRTTSLDELPQLWNILCGDMSLVGPRPIVDSPAYDASYINDYPREFAVYKSVRPGLTGMWQVTCRNSGVYEMRIYWDMYYLRNWSLWLDLYIILRTVRTVLLREGSA